MTLCSQLDFSTFRFFPPMWISNEWILEEARIRQRSWRSFARYTILNLSLQKALMILGLSSGSSLTHHLPNRTMRAPLWPLVTIC